MRRSVLAIAAFVLLGIFFCGGLITLFVTMPTQKEKNLAPFTDLGTPTPTESISTRETTPGPTKTYTFSNGIYVSGSDFEPGVYNFEAIKGNGNVSSSNMFTGGLNEVMGVAQDEMHSKTFMNAKLPKGIVLTISNGVTIKMVKK